MDTPPFPPPFCSSHLTWPAMIALLDPAQETCHRSKVLVERRRCENGVARVSTSKRLHDAAHKQRLRQDARQMQVNAAARGRANPDLAAKNSRFLFPNYDRGDVGERLYELALLKRKDALERELLARNAPRDTTFRPEIGRRSASLAKRRRESWRVDDGGEALEEGFLAVEEGLLAEGRVYERRRLQRQARQAQLDNDLRQGAGPNPHSERLLRGVAPRALSGGRGSAANAGQNSGARVTTSTAVGNDGVDDTVEVTFKPALAARRASNKLLESR